MNSKPEFDPQEVEAVMDESARLSQPEKPPLPEAPASATVKVVSPKGYSWLFTMRSDSAEDLLFKTLTMEGHFENYGWKPVEEGKQAAKAQGTPQPTGEPPVCAIHGKPMEWKSGVSKTNGRPYGFWSCTEKLADGSYCPYKPTAKK